ncbi:uncharacterized protein [Zea mays]|jgi:hypothetical protein|uniref:uncharacterized protein n=1 Tax=Zea mays TaxID=4577 RepID=UPI00165277C9|nr:uncharacterized protein LOC118476853 [Zea mays]
MAPSSDLALFLSAQLPDAFSSLCRTLCSPGVRIRRLLSVPRFGGCTHLHPWMSPSLRPAPCLLLADFPCATSRSSFHGRGFQLAGVRTALLPPARRASPCIHGHCARPLLHRGGFLLPVPSPAKPLHAAVDQPPCSSHRGHHRPWTSDSPMRSTCSLFCSTRGQWHSPL